ncbi:MAG TPA: NADH-quinone oxidoreductase subunit J, partial [Caldimonas sp.]
MIEALLQNIDTLLLLFCSLGALTGAALMLVLRQPMRVAMALIATMIMLGGIYGLLGVHFIAAFQILIYVGAVMVFMVYAIMLLEVREASGRRYSRLLVPGIAGLLLLLGAIVISVWRPLP